MTRLPARAARVPLLSHRRQHRAPPVSGRALLVATLAVSLTLALSLFVVFHTLLVLSGLSSIEAPVYGFGCCGGALG